MKIVLILTAIMLSFHITSFELIDVGNTTVGVVCFDIPIKLQKAARTHLLRGAVNTITFGTGVAYTDNNLTVVEGYSPLFRRSEGLDCNIQAAARSGGDSIHITIGVPALPPDSY